jgi:hypothetical protein
LKKTVTELEKAIGQRTNAHEANELERERLDAENTVHTEEIERASRTKKKITELFS